MEKIIIKLLTTCLCISIALLDVNAQNYKPNPTTIELNNIENYIVSGNGSPDNPYVLEESCPLKLIMNAEVVRQMEESSNQTESNSAGVAQTYAAIGEESTYLGNTVAGYNQTNGGYNYNQKVQIDGSVAIQRIAYYTKEMTNEEFLILEQQNFIASAVQQISGTALTFAGAYASIRAKVAAAGLLAQISTASMYAGVGLAIYGTASVYNYWINPYRNAAQARTGLLKICYLYSYHGAWYKSITSAKWTRSPTAYYPNNCFGGGRYYSDLSTLPNITF